MTVHNPSITVEIVEATDESLQSDLLELATSEGFTSVTEFEEAFASGAVSHDSWAAWEYRSLMRLLSGDPEK